MLLSRYISVWGQQVSIHGARAGCGVGDAGVLFRRDDRGPAVLREMDQSTDRP